MLRRQFSFSSSQATTAVGVVASSSSSQVVHSVLRNTKRHVAVADYKAPLDFDPVQMKFFWDGVETEMMDDSRRVALAAVQQHKLSTSNRSVERESSILRDRLRFMLNPPSKILNNNKRGGSDRSSMANSGGEQFLISLAQYRTTPAKFYAMYEATALIDSSLSFALASHFSLSSCLASVYRPHISAITSGNVDTGASFFVGAHNEVIADDAPFQTVCELDKQNGTLRVSTREEGGGKVLFALGTSARYAVVSAQYLSGGGTMQPHLLLMELRDATGKLRQGITLKGIGSTGGSVDGLATCILHLDAVHVPVENLLSGDFADIINSGNVVSREASLDAAAAAFDKASQKAREEAEQEKSPLATNAMLNVATSQRLSSAAISLGKCKRTFHDLVRFCASKKVLGPEGERSHPAMGIQVIQKRIARALVELVLLNTAYHRVFKSFTTPSVAHQLSTEDFVELAAVSSALVELLSSIGKLGTELCGWQATPASVGFNEAISLSAIMREGSNPDYVRFLYSRECAENNIGLLKSVSAMRQKVFGTTRFSKWMSNPFFSPTQNDINRYLMLFGDKEQQTRSILQADLRGAERIGAEDMFYVWNNEHYRTVLSHSDAYLNCLCLKSMNTLLEKNTDPYNNRVLNDCAWLFSLLKIEDDLHWYLANNAIKLRQVATMRTMIDNLCNLLSHQAVHLSDCFSVPRLDLETPIAKDWEKYYGPPPPSSSSSSSSS